jgi:hypothetical protein
MTRSGDSHEDMERFALDPDTADRLLSGALEPEDAPHRYGEVACLLRIAAGPTSGALDGEAAAVATVVEATRSSHSPAPSARTHRPTTVRTRLRAAAAIVAAVLALTGGLAAADVLPGPAQRAAADALAVVGVHVPNHQRRPETGPSERGRRPEERTGANSSTVPSTTAISRQSTTTAHGVDGTVVQTPGASSTATVTAPSQPGAGAGRPLTTTPSPAGPAGGAPQNTPSPGHGAGQPAAAPAPSSSPSPSSSSHGQPVGPTAGPQQGGNGNSNGVAHRADPQRGAPNGQGAVHRATPARGQ